jgi:hypothetical protein
LALDWIGRPTRRDKASGLLTTSVGTNAPLPAPMATCDDTKGLLVHTRQVDTTVYDE